MFDHVLIVPAYLIERQSRPAYGHMRTLEYVFDVRSQVRAPKKRSRDEFPHATGRYRSRYSSSRCSGRTVCLLPARTTTRESPSVLNIYIDEPEVAAVPGATGLGKLTTAATQRWGAVREFQARHAQRHFIEEEKS